MCLAIKLNCTILAMHRVSLCSNRTYVIQIKSKPSFKIEGSSPTFVCIVKQQKYHYVAVSQLKHSALNIRHFDNLFKVGEIFILKFFLSFIFILPTQTKTSKVLYIVQLSCNYPDLLPEMPRYCCPVEIAFILVFKFYGDMTEI